MYTECTNVLFDVEMGKCMIRYFEMCFGVFGRCVGCECVMKKFQWYFAIEGVFCAFCCENVFSWNA